MSIKKILAFTSTRSDYDLLSYIYKELNADPECELQLLVSGMHLSKTYGMSYDQVLADGMKVLAAIETLIDSDSRASRIKTASLLMQNSIHDITKFAPDVIVFAGDREDAMIASLLGAYLHIPTLHFFGGDHTTDGNVDNPIRHACSKISSAHFVMCDEHKKRLESLGEPSHRIFNIGSPAIDKLIFEKQLSKDEIFKAINFPVPEKYAVLIFHPIIGDEDVAGEQFAAIVEALIEKGFTVLCGTPNVDSGNKDILAKIEHFTKTQPLFKSYKNLSRNLFVNLLRHASLLAGNSSAGILEAATLKLKVVNAGRRQVGRMTGGNVVFCDTSKEAIKTAIDQTNTPEFKRTLQTLVNPYGDGHSSKKAVEIIKKTDWTTYIQKTEDPLMRGTHV